MAIRTNSLVILLVFSLFLIIATFVSGNRFEGSTSLLSKSINSSSMALASSNARVVRVYNGSKLLMVPQHVVIVTNYNNLSITSHAFKPHAHPLGSIGSKLNSQASKSTGNPASTPPPAIWDEQIGTTFTQSFSSMAYNVTAVAQNSSYGYGPAYLLNGLTGMGYWYQVGLSYNWPFSSGGYDSGFSMVYDVFNSSGRVVLPAGGGGGLSSFSGPVHPGDKIMLNLYFQNGNVMMLAYDFNTSASAQVSFSAKGSSAFIGDSSSTGNNNGFFTGLMTEQYRVNKYTGDEEEVPYVLSGQGISSAWQWADEWVPTNDSVLFITQTPSPVSFSNPNPLNPFIFDGARQYTNATTEITGGISVAAEPLNITITAGENANITSIATNGTAPYSYQWFEEPKGSSTFSQITGANSSTLDFSTNKSIASGVYKLISTVTDYEHVVESSQSVGINVINTATTTTSSTTIPTTTTTILSCSGTPSLALSPNPATPSSGLDAVVSGLSGCSGVTITIKNYQGCTSGSTIASFASGATGGSVAIINPGSAGQFGYYACASGKSSAKAILTISNTTTTVTTTSTTTVPTTTTTISSSCSGTPSLALSPNPATPSSGLDAVVSGLSGCSGVTIAIKDYQGCASGSTITSFASGATGGSVAILNPGSVGEFGYYACVSGGQSSAKAILTISNTTTTSTIPTTTTIPQSGAVLILPASTAPSSSAENVKVTVSGRGFTPDSLVNFGYSPIPPFSSAIIALTSNSSGDWTGSFMAPWDSGSYNMTAVDSSGQSSSATLVVT